jgi:hypothetical protein
MDFKKVEPGVEAGFRSTRMLERLTGGSARGIRSYVF